MQIPKTGNALVDQTIGATSVSRSGNQLVDRNLNGTAEGVIQ